MKLRLADLLRRSEPKTDGYSRALQAARVRAAFERGYFAPALFALHPVGTDLIGTMAVDTRWRLYYNEAWVSSSGAEETAALLLHEVSHLLRDHAGRKRAAGVSDATLWNIAGDCEIDDDLLGDGLRAGESAETYFKEIDRARHTLKADCGSGAHGERRFWELPAGDDVDASPGVDSLKAELLRREVARQIDAMSPYSDEVPASWRRWARGTLAPQVDYMATLRHAVRRVLRDSTLGRYDRTYRRPNRRQTCYGNFLMPSFYQPRPRPGFLIDTSSSMGDTQLARAVSELGGLTRQLGYGADVVVACCDAAVHDVRRVFAGTSVALYGGGGTDIGLGLRAFIERKSGPIDVLVIVSDCRTAWPSKPPPFPVVTIRVGDGTPPPWGNVGANKLVSIEEPGGPARSRRDRGR